MPYVTHIVVCYLATYSNFLECLAIGKTSYNWIPPKPIGNTDNKYAQTEQHSHTHAAPSVDCNTYLCKNVTYYSLRMQQHCIATMRERMRQSDPRPAPRMIITSSSVKIAASPAVGGGGGGGGGYQ